MKVTVLKTRDKGIPYERGELKRQGCMEGELQVYDTRENKYNRIIKIAKLTTPYSVVVLFDVHILWLEGDKLCLDGWESVDSEAGVADFRQSWVCQGGFLERGLDNENMMPKRENWRH